MRVGSISTCSNPADTSLSRYSFSSSAPATQPTQSRMFCRICGSISPRVTTSETASRPPGLSTRKASRSTRSLSAERLITQFEMITSTELSGSGIFSISPRKNSTFSAPALRLFSLASASISSVISSPYAFPVGPTRLAESKTSMPPPEPKSRTTSPGFNFAKAVGLPQPSEACSASPGTCCICVASYKFEVIGSQLVPLASAVPQQLPLFPLSAACPYFSLTISLMFVLSMPPSEYLATFNLRSSIFDLRSSIFDFPFSIFDFRFSIFHSQFSIFRFALPAHFHDIFRLQRLVPRAALRIKKLQQFLERFGICRVPQKCALPLHAHQIFIPQLVQVMRQRRIGNLEFPLNVSNHQPLRMRRQKQLHDPQPGFRPHRREHVGILR